MLAESADLNPTLEQRAELRLWETVDPMSADRDAWSWAEPSARKQYLRVEWNLLDGANIFPFALRQPRAPICQLPRERPL
jgi:hypothetical protein